MTRLGEAITEIIRWNKDFSQAAPIKDDNDWEEFRARVKSAPKLDDDKNEYYMRNVWENGIQLKHTLEMVKKRPWNSANPDIPDTIALDEMGIPGPSSRDNYVWPDVDPNAPPFRRNAHLDGDTAWWLSKENRELKHYHKARRVPVGTMNDRDFRDRCVQANGKLYALYQMGLPELSPVNHLRAETIEKWMASPCRCNAECAHVDSVISPMDSDSLVKILSKLQMNRANTTKMMFGYMAEEDKYESDIWPKLNCDSEVPYHGNWDEKEFHTVKEHQWRAGVKSMDESEFKDLVYYLEDLESQLPKLLKEGEVEPVQLDDYRAFYQDQAYKLIEWGVSSTGPDKGNPAYDLKTAKGQMAYIEDMARDAYREDPFLEPNPSEIHNLIERGFGVEPEDDQESENQVYEDIDFKSTGDGWTAFPLHYGEDTVKYHWCACIRTATPQRLWAWKRMMGKFKNITYQQRRDLWSRINERQEQLVAKIESKLTPMVKTIIKEIQHLSAGQAKALIYAYQVGGSFERFTSFDFDGPGDPDMAFYLWDFYKKL